MSIQIFSKYNIFVIGESSVNVSKRNKRKVENYQNDQGEEMLRNKQES